MADQPPAAAVHAAGVVLWRRGTEGCEVALVHRPKYDDWSFPKGKVKPGEHLLRAVLRETEEETGIVPRLGRRLSPSHYVTDGRLKRVDYWAATPAAAAVPVGAVPVGAEAVGGFVPNDEVDRVEWLRPVVAAEALSYGRDRDVLREFVNGPVATTPLVVLRHASAGDKRDWRDDDVLRPLDSRGRAEVGALTGLVAGFGPVRVISSATARCVETVLPTALAQRTTLATDLAFTNGETTPAVARARMAELVSEGAPVLVCTHGELVSDLILGICERFGEKPPDDPGLRKGGFWVLHLATGEGGIVTGLAASERHSTLP